jgi:hypothetical protein
LNHAAYYRHVRNTIRLLLAFAQARTGTAPATCI